VKCGDFLDVILIALLAAGGFPKGERRIAAHRRMSIEIHSRSALHAAYGAATLQPPAAGVMPSTYFLFRYQNVNPDCSACGPVEEGAAGWATPLERPQTTENKPDRHSVRRESTKQRRRAAT
jgi:hypothetical protein